MTAAEVVLAEVVRSGWVESEHLGSAVVCDSRGQVVGTLGDPDQVVYLRSTAKPLQALAVRALGPRDVSADALAAACGSHWGEQAHSVSVLATLDRAGLGVGDLQCPPAWPTDKSAREAAERLRTGPSPLWHNCSGKHAFMLAGSVAAGFDPGRYLDPDGPLQTAVTAGVTAMTGATPVHTGTDGCGAPTWVMPLTALATGFARLAAGVAAGEEGPAALAAAVRAEPVLLAGTRALDTAVVRATDGRVLAKIGAEAVYAAADLERGLGLALKVRDGSNRAAGPALLAVLGAAGWLDEATLAELERVGGSDVLGGGRPVGRVRSASAKLSRATGQGE
jgi:L-asparaginase II